MCENEKRKEGDWRGGDCQAQRRRAGGGFEMAFARVCDVSWGEGDEMVQESGIFSIGGAANDGSRSSYSVHTPPDTRLCDGERRRRKQ